MPSKCAKKSCYKQPYYNLPNEKKGLYCSLHKTDDMINVINKRCAEQGCHKIPVFNIPNEKKGLYCSLHKIDDMINVFSRLCAEYGCDKQPLYNIPNEKKGLYCSNHKKDGMINVVDKKCAEEGCHKRPLYNLSNEKKGLYCSIHKKDGMVDVINKKCIEEGCNKQPYHNLPNEKKGLYCSNHKKDGMINIVDKKCAEEGCNKIPVFNIPNEKTGLFCCKHKKDDMVNVVSNICKTYLCSAQSQICGYCCRCFYLINPNDNRAKRYKSKENEVVNYITYKLCGINLIHDKPLCGDLGCLNVRPDVLINLNKHSIIIEVDEDQHKKSEYSCEERRMDRIQEVLDRPVVFIRFNPDTYEDKDGKLHKGCFIKSKGTGLTTISKQQENKWNKRLQVLEDYITTNIQKEPEYPLTVIKLFYDGY